MDLPTLPADPESLFYEWLDAALAANVPEPHALTLATVDADGVPDARTVILKDVDERGWAVAGPASSSKGAQLAGQPVAALNFWWQPLVRAVRVRGPVVEASRADSDADLAARGLTARSLVDEGDWTLWRLQAMRVEFWQGSPDRRHRRVVYTRRVDGWDVAVSREGKAVDPAKG
jgi:pyridoxamine 5'-phosphate oxidase